ncbi:hypothetical protein FRC11_006261 [Ceratobasidium sp. 423]|nr:hypothetical protein FRC11_006261 [Ceratobasidium sp. 423]
MKEFLARVNVTRLLLEVAGTSPFNDSRGIEEEERMSSMQDICSMVSDLESLTLVVNGDSRSNLLKVTTRPTSTNEYEPLCPMLRTFYAINWTLNKEDIRNIAKAHPVLNKMRLAGCKLPARPEFDEWLTQEVQCAKVMDTKWGPYRSSRDYPDPTWD